MLTLIVLMNCILAVVLFWVALQIWKVRRTLAKVADTLHNVDRSTHSVLYRAPEAIDIGQRGTHALRLKYQQLEQQLARLEQIVGILGLGKTLWQQRQRLGQVGSRRKRRRSEKLWSS